MSGGHIPPPPPPVVGPVDATVPPTHEVVIDTHHRQTTSPVTVDLDGGQAVVHVEGLGENRSVPKAAERSIRKSDETEETVD